MDNLARPQIATIEVAPPPDLPDPEHPQVIVHGRPFYTKFMFLIPAILVVTVIMGASLLGQKYFSQTAPTPAPTPIPTLLPASPRATLMPVVKNKIYNNSTYQFTFKYPELYLIHDCDDGVKIFSRTTQIENPTTLCSQEPLGAVNLQITDESVLPNLENATKESIKLDFVEGDLYKLDGKFYLSFQYKEKYYLLSVLSERDQDLATTIQNSFKFTSDITTDWPEYAVAEYGFIVKYPPEWKFEDKGGGKFEIVKNSGQADLHRIVIEAQNNLENANLTASQIISSTRNLAGWADPPSVDIQNIGGGTAQVLQGQFGEYWHTFMAIWRQKLLVQLFYNDTLSQSEARVFAGILSTFRFTN